MIPCFDIENELYARISLAAYNDMTDIEKLCDAVEKCCQDEIQVKPRNMFEF